MSVNLENSAVATGLKKVNFHSNPKERPCQRMYIALISHASKVKWSEVAQACPTLCDPMDCSLPGSSVHRIFQARVLEWVVISFSRHASKVMLKFLQASVRHYVNWELLDVQVGFRKGRGMREQHSLDHRKSKGISEKKICFCFTD